MISPKKQSMREKNTEDSNVVLSKNKTKASSQTNTIRKVADVTKRLDNVEYLIKIEDKNKKQLIERYEKQIEKTEKIIEKLEVELKGVIKELNDKETKIYEIQRVKFDSFKQDISKYENIYLDLEEKHKNLIIQISEIKVKEHHSYNQNFMLQEDCLSLRNEIALSKRKIGEYKDILINIEKSYPKEFEFLLEDIRLEKELQEIKQQKKQINVDIDKIEKNKVKMKKEVDSKESERTEIENELHKLNDQIQHLLKDEHLNKLEDYIIKNINDILIFEKFKSIVANYYTQKNFDLEHEINLKLMSNLSESQNEMKNEFLEIRKEKSLLKAKIEKELSDMIKTSSSKNIPDKSKMDIEITVKTQELDHINNEINCLDLSCKKKETLFNKYIILLRSRCKKTKEESYYEMNPALIIEIDFEDKFKEELLKLIEDDNNFSPEEKVKNKNLIEIYFKELSNREKLLQNALSNKLKLVEDNEFLNNECDKIKESYKAIETDVSQKRQIQSELIIKERVLHEKIELRNMSLSSNLEKLGELEFDNYLKSNDNVLKNMKKIYGNKVLDKVFKVQKQKFMENVIVDHTYKKNKVNEYVSLINSQEALLFFYNNKVSSMEEESTKGMKRYQDEIDYRENKIKDSEIIEESKSDLKSKIEEIVSKQFKEIEAEKKQLEFKFNLSYYFEKIKDLNGKLEVNVSARNELNGEYNRFKNIIDEKEQKLYLEDMDLKNNLISMQVGVKEDTGRAHLPFRTAAAGTQKDKYILNQDNQESLEEDNTENNEENIPIKSPSYNEEENKNVLDGLIINNNVTNDEGLVGSVSSLKSIHNKKDPLISLSIERVRPLIEGLNLLKRYNNISFKIKPFDPMTAAINPPESCGYNYRNFKVNPIEELIEIKNLKTKIIEQKLSINNIKSILLSSSAKLVIKNKKNLTKKPNSEIEKLVQNEYVVFTVLHTEGTLDLIAPNFAVFSTFQIAMEELIKQKKNIYSYLK